jgi:DMSO/TMAO reductase YedYZ molybdopterin-dependent catalytic subunit
MNNDSVRPADIADIHAVPPTTPTATIQPASPLPPLQAARSSDDLSRSTRRALLGWGAGILGMYGAWKWIGTRPLEDGIPWPLRKMLDINEQIGRGYFSHDRLTREYKFMSARRNPRVNGRYGLSQPIDASRWTMNVEGTARGAQRVTLADIKRLPRVETTMRLCCIEGWSIFVNWSGVRFRDFFDAYPPATFSGKPAEITRPDDFFQYVGLETPDGGYYVGIDIASALHPQTLLAYEIDGQPLTQDHGAPLRLVIPTKYGVKNLKRIGVIRYAQQRPRDYWAERGYDWYAGL